MEKYNLADANDRLIINLRDISHTMRFLYEGKGSQKRILIVLNEAGTMTQNELTKRLGIQPGSVSEVLAKLESAGMLVRTPSEADRRTVDIALTGKGKALALEAAKQRSERHEEMFACLSEGEKSQLLAMLEKINADWKQRYQDIAEKREHSHGCREPHGRSGHHDRTHHMERSE